MTSRKLSPLGRLARALAAATPSVELRLAQAELPNVTAAQLWRARRGPRSLLLLTVTVNGPTSEAIPVTIDEGSNADAVDLPPNASLIAAPLTVWPTLITCVPTRTLEQYNGPLTVELPAGDVLTGIRSAGRPGRAVVTAADDPLILAARLRDQMNNLAAAPLPGGTGDLPTLLKATGLPVADLTKILGVSSATVLQLRRGQRAISADQAQNLAPSARVEPDVLLAANPAPPEPLITWMSQPRQRRRVVQLADYKRIDEDTAFADATYSTLALAARTAGNRDADSAWAQLGERYFQSVLDER